jgi:hypothetical protein
MEIMVEAVSVTLGPNRNVVLESLRITSNC